MSTYRRLSPAQKAKAWARLPQHCTHCQTTESLTLDHIVARALGGTNALTNLQVLCTNCNAAKAVGEHARSQAIRRAEFAQQALLIHGPRYDYGRVLHPEGTGNVRIGCPTHSPFWLPPAAHLAGGGCPQCHRQAQKEARQRRHLARYRPRLPG